MKRHHLLVLPVLWSALVVVAVPDPSSFLQQPLNNGPAASRSSSSSSSSSWRSLSDRLIGSLWGPDKTDGRDRGRGDIHPDRPPPPHILARYGEDVVVRFNMSTSEEAKSLAEAADTLLLDIWEFAEDWVDIRLAQDVVPSLLGLLPPSMQQSHVPLPHLQGRNLAQAVHDTYPAPRDQQSLRSTPDTPPYADSHPFGAAVPSSNHADSNIFFSDYQPLSVIEPWLRLMASLFTTHTRLLSIGTSYQNRDIPALRIGVHPTDPSRPPVPRKTILVTAGLHAREWISTSTATYIAYSLITGYGKSPTLTHLLETFDFVVIPTLNPDGYAHTWTTDRLWRKNRQPTSVRFCPGLDLDRTFGFEWDGARTAGNPCSESYAGEAAFAGHEAAQLAQWARNETENGGAEFVGLLDLHSYSQQILYPYSYSCAATPPGQEDLMELAFGLRKAMRAAAGGVDYSVMAACEGNQAVAPAASSSEPLSPKMEGSGGSALDWFYRVLGVRFAYQVKLRDRGVYGFLLPREYIVPTGREVMDAVVYLGGFLGGEGLAGVVGVGGEREGEEDKAEGLGTGAGDHEDGEEERGDEDEDEDDEDEDDEDEEDGDVDMPLALETLGEGDVLEKDWLFVEDLAPESVQWELRRARRR